MMLEGLVLTIKVLYDVSTVLEWTFRETYFNHVLPKSKKLVLTSGANIKAFRINFLRVYCEAGFAYIPKRWHASGQ